MTSHRLYVVVNGRRPGIYEHWYGEDGAYEQVKDVPEAWYKAFDSRCEAWDWLHALSKTTLLALAPELLEHVESGPRPRPQNPYKLLARGQVVIFAAGVTGSATRPARFGVVLCYGEHRREISNKVLPTTRVRINVIACIAGLQALKQQCTVSVFCASRYLRNRMAVVASRSRVADTAGADTRRINDSGLRRRLGELVTQYRVRFHTHAPGTPYRESILAEQLADGTRRTRA